MENEYAWKALSDHNRRKILELLKNEALTAGELVEKLSQTNANVSQHLKVLVTGEIVNVFKKGLFRVYSINTVKLEMMMEWLSQVTPSKSQTILQVRKKRAKME